MNASSRVMSERRAGILCALLATLGPFSLTIYTPALPVIASQLGAPVAAVQLSISFFFAGLAAAQLVCGPLSDALGRRPILILFFGIYILGSLLAISADDVMALIAARLLQGIGAAAGIALSRAIVRDLFDGAQAAKVLALVSLVFAIGPAVAPSVGGILLGIWGWRSIFAVMLALGLGVIAVNWLLLRETIVPDPSRLRPREVLSAYGRILRQPLFLLPTMVLANTNGVVYSQATVLPFVMINQVGLTPQGFGASMLVQSGAFLFGSVIVRRLLAVVTPVQLLTFGLAVFMVGSAALPVLRFLFPLSLLTVMGPIGLCGFAIAFTMPTTTVSSLTSFPENSGTAAAAMGFLQMGIGLLGGMAAMLFSDPSDALVVVSPVMASIATVCFLLWRFRTSRLM